jgi:hypothetical protein
MSTKVFDIQDVLKSGWQNFTKAPALFIGLIFIAFAVTLVFGMVFNFLPAVVMSLVNALVTSYFMLSTIKAAVMLGNGETPTWNVLKNDINSYLRFFVTSIILSIIFVIASIMLIIPLLLAMAIFFPVPYIIVNRTDLSIIDAFKMSWKITTPQFLPCLIFIILSLVLAMIGLIPIGLGLLIVVPVIYTTGAVIYKKLEAADSPSTETTAV